MGPIDAYFFDLDGTLVDTELLWARAVQELVRDNGGSCSMEDVLAIVFGRSWRDIHQDLVVKFPPLARWDMDSMAIVVRVYYKRLSESASIVIESSARLLHRLAAEKPVAVVSGSPRADVESGVKLAQAHEHVRFLLGAEDYSPGKPHPAGYLRAAEMLGVRPEHCLVFEDSWAGVTSAKAAGMWCVGIARDGAHRQNLGSADWVLEDLEQYDETAFWAHVRAQQASLPQ